MSAKPTILYIEADTLHGSENFYRSALCWILKNLCHCEVLTYSSYYELIRNIEKVEKLFNSGNIILTIIKQDFDCDQTIELVRKKLSRFGLLVIIPEPFQESEIKKHLSQDETYIFGYTDQGLVQLVNKLAHSWTPPANMPEGLTSEQVWFEKQLEQVHCIYDEEVDKIRKMPKSERESFHLGLGQDSSSERVGFGRDVLGYAFDPVTCESATTNSEGLHSYAKEVLKYRVEIIEAIKQCKDSLGEDRYAIAWRLVSGLVFTKVKGFKTPILFLPQRSSTCDDLIKAAQYESSQKRFIAINAEGELFV